jgi:hypothetical protein
VDRHDLSERATRHMGPVADAFDQIKSVRTHLGRGLRAHPAQDLFRVGQEREDRRRLSGNLHFAPNEQRFVHPSLLEHDP